MPGAGSQGVDGGHPTAWTGEEGREAQGREAHGGTECREGAGEVLTPAPSTRPRTRAAAAQEASGVLTWGGRPWLPCPRPPHPAQSPDHSTLPPSPSIQLQGGITPSEEAAVTQKVQAPDPGLRAGSGTAGPGLEPQPPQSAPTRWKAGDGQEVAEGSGGSVSVCLSISHLPHDPFPPWHSWVCLVILSVKAKLSSLGAGVGRLPSRELPAGAGRGDRVGGSGLGSSRPGLWRWGPVA